MNYGGLFVIGGTLIIVCIGLIVNNKRKKKSNEATEYQNAVLNYMNKNNISVENMEICFIVNQRFEIPDENNQTKYVITGTIEKGTINVGDTLNYIDKMGNVKTAKVLDIEQFRKKLSSASVGQNVGIQIDTNEKIAMLFK